MSDTLQRILATKREEVAAARASVNFDQIKFQAEQKFDQRDFLGSIANRQRAGKPAVIAEIKKASPSKGVLRENFDPVRIARDYAANGAAALSVLTDSTYFQGKNTDLHKARVAAQLPVLRKDFIIDAYQVYESRVLGADAILLIAAALDDAQMKEFETIARALRMAVLVEVHDAVELERALKLKTPLIGINNRNLKTFQTRIETTLELVNQVPRDCEIVSESGIATQQDVARLRDAGVETFLVGEAFMRAQHPGAEMARLFDLFA